MLHPNQFVVDQAWIVFQVNDTPIPTEENGDFNIFALMDAASCYLVSSKLVSATTDEPTIQDVRHLFEEGSSHHNRLPETLFIPSEMPSQSLAAEAQHQGITVVYVPEAQLEPFIGEAREAFVEHFTRGGDES
jgi:hypothetical protein